MNDTSSCQKTAWSSMLKGASSRSRNRGRAANARWSGSTRSPAMPVFDPDASASDPSTTVSTHSKKGHSRMNIADINDAPADGPTRFGLHSVEGFGKTTLAAYFPAPVFIASENGFPRDLPFRPKRFPHPETWNDVRTAIASLTTDKHDRETLVVDTVDHVEPLLHRFLCQRDSGRKTEMNRSGNELISIEDYGFGKGYIAAEEEFRSLIADLDTLQRKRGMHIVLLMHSSPKKVNNLFGADFDKYEPKMHARISAIVKEWVENLFFGYFEVAAGKLGDEKKAKGVSTGRRLLGTRANALFDAKNRMNLPAEIELGQPEVLIPYLLGEHLADQAAPTSRSKSVAPRVTKQEPAPKTEKAPAKTNGKSNGKAEAKPED